MHFQLPLAWNQSRTFNLSVSTRRQMKLKAEEKTNEAESQQANEAKSSLGVERSRCEICASIRRRILSANRIINYSASI